MSAVVDFPVKPEARPYLDAASIAAAGDHAGEPDWLAQQRRRALARFAEQGFPSRRGEAWRYLDLHALEQSPLLPARTGHSQQPAAACARLLAGARPTTLQLIGSHGGLCMKWYLKRWQRGHLVRQFGQLIISEIELAQCRQRSNQRRNHGQPIVVQLRSSM